MFIIWVYHLSLNISYFICIRASRNLQPISLRLEREIVCMLSRAWTRRAEMWLYTFSLSLLTLTLSLSLSLYLVLVIYHENIERDRQARQKPTSLHPWIGPQTSVFYRTSEHGSWAFRFNVITQGNVWCQNKISELDRQLHKHITIYTISTVWLNKRERNS